MEKESHVIYTPDLLKIKAQFILCRCVSFRNCHPTEPTPMYQQTLLSLILWMKHIPILFTQTVPDYCDWDSERIRVLKSQTTPTYDEWDYEKRDAYDFYQTEGRRLLNSYYEKDKLVVTDRFTIGKCVHTLKICRCWKSKQFPYCDDTHNKHNKFHKDNVGPIIIDGPTLADHIRDKYTKKTPNRSITYSTNPTLSDSQVDRNREAYRNKHTYSDMQSFSGLSLERPTYY